MLFEVFYEKSFSETFDKLKTKKFFQFLLNIQCFQVISKVFRHNYRRLQNLNLQKLLQSFFLIFIRKRREKDIKLELTLCSSYFNAIWNFLSFFIAFRFWLSRKIFI